MESSPFSTRDVKSRRLKLKHLPEILLSPSRLASTRHSAHNQRHNVKNTVQKVRHPTSWLIHHSIPPSLFPVPSASDVGQACHCTLGLFNKANYSQTSQWNKVSFPSPKWNPKSSYG